MSGWPVQFSAMASRMAVWYRPTPSIPVNSMAWGIFRVRIRCVRTWIDLPPGINIGLSIGPATRTSLVIDPLPDFFSRLEEWQLFGLYTNLLPCFWIAADVAFIAFYIKAA